MSKNTGILMDEKGNEFYPKSANDIRQCDRRKIFSDVCAFEYKSAYTGLIGLKIGNIKLDGTGDVETGHNTFLTLDGNIYDYTASTHFNIYIYVRVQQSDCINARAWFNNSIRCHKVYWAIDSSNQLYFLFEPYSTVSTWNYPNISITNMSLGWIGGDDENYRPWTEGWQMELFEDTSSFTKVGEILTMGTISGGDFNKGSWNEPGRGALNQIIDNSGSQHSVIVGKDVDGNRLYGIDFYDNTTVGNQIMRFYCGNDYLYVGCTGQSVVNYSGMPIICRRACFTNSTNENTFSSGTYVPLNTTYYNKSDGLIVNNQDGSFTINWTGYVKISFNVWLGGLSSDVSRPWVRLIRSDGVVFADCIALNGTSYQNFGVADRICYVTAGQWFGINVGIQGGGTYRTDGGTGNTNSYITIELM